MTNPRDSVMRISRKGMLVWIGLMLFIAAWMFVLGILVGRGMAPVNLEVGKLEQELAALKAKMLRQEQSRIDKRASGQKDAKSELGFYEALKDPKQKTTFRPVPKPQPKPAPRPVTKPPAASVKPKSAPKPKPVAVPKPAPKPKPKPAVKPTATTPAAPVAKPSTGKFTVQVSAFREAQRATQLVKDLRKKGFQAYQIRTEMPSKGVWYRVRVGAFTQRSQAAKTANQLRAGKYGAMVVEAR